MELPATVTLEFPLFCSKSEENSERAGHRSRANSGQSPVVSFAMTIVDLSSQHDWQANGEDRIAKSGTSQFNRATSCRTMSKVSRTACASAASGANLRYLPKSRAAPRY